MAQKKNAPENNPDNTGFEKTPDSSLKQPFIQDFGLAYQSFGLPKLMGHIVGLFLYNGTPLSLDEITDQLQVSKGPVSQIMRRLREHTLVEKIWVPGSRRDFYKLTDNIFGVAFSNHARLLGQNKRFANKYLDLIDTSADDQPETFSTTMQEMSEFYTLMDKHLGNFLDEWNKKKNS